MWMRYPLALCAAYLVFLALLWLWLRTRAEDWIDVPHASSDIDLAPGTHSPTCTQSPTSGGGGDFGGGGASANFDAVGTPAHMADTSWSVKNPVGESIGSVTDADELAIPLIVVALGVGLALSSLYVVYSAPVLFAELILDGVLSASLYHRLRNLNSRHWIETAVRRTALPFALTAIFLCACGAAMQWYAPQAHSLGAVLRHSTSSL